MKSEKIGLVELVMFIRHHGGLNDNGYPKIDLLSAKKVAEALACHSLVMIEKGAKIKYQKMKEN